nr:MAG TPA: hypothetical protein [Caudoviricetes sp.]
MLSYISHTRYLPLILEPYAFALVSLGIAYL